MGFPKGHGPPLHGLHSAVLPSPGRAVGKAFLLPSMFPSCPDTFQGYSLGYNNSLEAAAWQGKAQAGSGKLSPSFIVEAKLQAPGVSAGLGSRVSFLALPPLCREIKCRLPPFPTPHHHMYKRPSSGPHGSCRGLLQGLLLSAGPHRRLCCQRGAVIPSLGHWQASWG